MARGSRRIGLAMLILSLALAVIVSARWRSAHVTATPPAPETDRLQIDVASYLRTAMARCLIQESDAARAADQFVVIVETAGGERYGEIRRGAPGAPDGELVIDGHIMDELGLAGLRIYGRLNLQRWHAP